MDKVENQTSIQGDPYTTTTGARHESQSTYGEVKQMMLQFLIILPIVILSALGAGPFDQLRDQIVYMKLGGNITSDSNTTQLCQSINGSAKSAQDSVQAHATTFKLYMDVGSCVMGVLCMPFWMGWSDTSGRQIGLIAATMGNFIKASCFWCVLVFPEVPLSLLIVGDALQGMLGKGIAIIFAAAASHAADVTVAGKRTLLMFVLEFTFMCSAAIGNVGVGYMVRSWGFMPVVLTSMGLNAACLLYTVTVFECCAKQKGVTHGGQAACLSSAAKYITSTWTTFTRVRLGKPYVRRLLYILELMLFVYYCGFLGTYGIVNLYALGYPLCWGSLLIGINNGVMIAAGGVFPLLFGLLFFRHGPTPWLILIGLCCGGGGCVLMGVSTTTWMMLVGSTLFAIRALISGTGRSIIADLVDDHEVGAAMAGYGIVAILAHLVSSLVFNIIYSKTVSFCKSCVFYVGAGCFFTALSILGIFVVVRKFSMRKTAFRFSQLKDDDAAHNFSSSEN